MASSSSSPTVGWPSATTSDKGSSRFLIGAVNSARRLTHSIERWIAPRPGRRWTMRGAGTVTFKRVAVIGGGVVGLAVAERAVRLGHDVTVLEKEDSWAVHQTGHNSGVIHAGPYYKPGSLKAAMSTAGNRSMTAFAQEHDIPFEICGKLIVAVDEEEIPRLRALHERSIANGVPVRMLTAAEAHEYEPDVASVAALRVETTGIIDYTAVSVRLAELAAEHGATMMRSTEVRNIHETAGGVQLEHDGGTVDADLLINCAGLYSDRIARMAGLVPEARIIPFRGEYYELTAEAGALVRGLIYPVPDPDLPFLGVHLTRMIDGSVHAGPNAVTALAREGYTWRDINVGEAFGDLTYPGFLRMASHNIPLGISEVWRSFSQRTFAKSLARLVPAIGRNDIVRAAAGVRAQAIGRDGRLVDDFLIQRTENQVHVLNAPSPAATSALEIARHITAVSELD
ncbi:L-2-hydroxyglutarate oxidase [Agromyces laixinhei]|uniref:L-2-hydroxyglutarate oxidase n=1 Tax=Agromyces laixinhei TaxID=2585717 RepID=UPI002FC3D603